MKPSTHLSTRPVLWLSGRSLLIGCVAVATLLTAGCGAPTAHFASDLVYLDKRAKQESAEVSRNQEQDISDILFALFGTPDDPFLPAGGDTGIPDIIDIDNLTLAAGRVDSDRVGRPHGLYREHCSHCHGTTGDGKGPTAAFLNPYPRDYRKGVFKFKSTPRGSRPTHEDLKRVLVNGVAGTAMPSFKLLPDGEIEALVDYVKYLAIRGEVERLLVDETTGELDTEDRLVNDESMGDSSELLLEDMLAGVVARWKRADSDASKVPARPEMEGEQLLASIDRGKHLFYGSVANCVKCHGDSQLGDGQVDDYDDWTKDYADDWIKETDQDKKDEMQQTFEHLGALTPRNIIPRNLRAGIYRGGRRPVDLYWRILNGIDGTPMPAAMMRQPGQAQGLTPNDIWDIVNYVQSLPYESMATTGPDEPVYQRLRQ